MVRFNKNREYIEEKTDKIAVQKRCMAAEMSFFFVCLFFKPNN